MKTKLIILILLQCLFLISINAQENEPVVQSEESEQNFSLSADFVSNYTWRGLALSEAPNIQPTLTYTFPKIGLTLGSFGSYSFGDFYSEVDLFASKTIGMFSIELWDYFLMDQVGNNRFFDFKNESTTHALEGILMFNGPENFPLKVTLGTFFYGADKDFNGDNNYSTYFEFAYPFKWKKNNLSVFMGGTPFEGLYANDFAINNIGITNEREIKINDHFSLPVSGSLIINPHLENIYLVLSISLEAND